MADPTSELTGSFELEAYESLRERADQALFRGDLAAARPLYEEAFDCAEASGDSVLHDRALCNLAGVLIECGESARVVPELRRILMANRDSVNCYLAAYALSRAHDVDQQYKKGIFYARLALDRLSHLDRRDWLASSHNQMGNLLLAESRFEQAAGELERALATTPDLPLLSRALILDNLGYCRFMCGARDEAFRLLLDSLRTLRRLGALPWQRHPHLSLSYCYLEIGRHRRALQHGFAGLKLAEEVGDRQLIKNALYLLGETANLMGAYDEARSCFESLQRRFYPGQHNLVHTLMSVDVRGLLNLRA